MPWLEMNFTFTPAFAFTSLSWFMQKGHQLARKKPAVFVRL